MENGAFFFFERTPCVFIFLLIISSEKLASCGKRKQAQEVNNLCPSKETLYL